MVSMAIASMWTSIAAWFTPTLLFCAANLIIATIFIASNNNKKHHDHGDPLTRISRVSSFLDRARSMNLSSSSSSSSTITTAESVDLQCPSPSKTPKYSSASRLAQSIHFSTNDEANLPESSSNADDDLSTISETETETQLLIQAAQAPSLFERVKSIRFSSVIYNDSPSQLVRSPSFLDRFKSFKISPSFDLTGATSSQRETTTVDTDDEHQVVRSRKSSIEIKKTRSELRISTPIEDEGVKLRRPATARERRPSDVNDEEVDARADDFISRFRQQLKLQRVESLVRYNKILNRRSN